MLLWSLLSILILGAEIPDFNLSERQQGYAVYDKNVYFVFDKAVYNANVEKVVVEGSFRDWDHNLEEKKWWLQPHPQQNGVWFLKVNGAVPPGSEFKFRAHNGNWLQPPETAPNRYNGNLLFGEKEVKLEMKAEVISPRDIRAIFNLPGNVPSLDPGDYRLSKADGIEIKISKVFYIRPNEVQIYPATDIDIRRVHYLQNKTHKLRSLVSYDGWYRTLYSDKKLGAFYEKRTNKTRFGLFAPRATSVTLYLYKQPGERHYERHQLVMDKYGVWEIALAGNLNGVYYDYTVHGPDEPGNHFFETTGVHITDPYGQVSVDSFGPCRVWPEVIPPRPVKGGRPAMEDLIAYEVHVQDFTRNLPVPENLKGTFSGFASRGLKNSSGETIGFDHLVDLGINAVHFQPVQEFLHFPEDKWKAAFSKDPYFIEQGIAEENYQWGYRITHFLAIESRFREKGSEWGAQNQQFRDLVEVLHDAGIAVIIDVVFNHSGERMDGRMDYFNFSVIDKPYYYRTTADLDYIGEYGTELKSEERPMVVRWLIDQCKNLIDQYGVDGFRIDLAGQTDEQTLITIRRELGSDIIIYGEPWIASADPEYESNPDWDWYKADSPITFFQDDARNAFKGPPSNPENKKTDRGYAGGDGNREAVKKALSAGFPEDDTPVDGINYLDIHDNWALADRFAKTDWDGRKGVDENRVKIAATLLFTSLGPVVIHGGTEFLRSKAHAPLEERKIKFEDSYLYFHGKRDTYNLAKANEFIWENKGKSKADASGQVYCDYKNMNDFWRGVIGLRNSTWGKVFRIKDKPPDNYYNWIEPENPKLLGYITAQTVFVAINTDDKVGKLTDVTLPEGSVWRLVGTTDRINLGGDFSSETYNRLKGGSKISIDMDAESLKIWINESAK